MAQNLRAKLSKDDRLMVHDISVKLSDNFAREAHAQASKTHVEVAKSAREVAEESVSSALRLESCDSLPLKLYISFKRDECVIPSTL